MCCFSRDVSVHDTRIFARPGEGALQYLVYAMNMESKEEGAMVLPLPVPPGTPEAGVEFIDLEKFPAFFDDLDKAFPEEQRARGKASPPGPASNAATLAVQKVGAYEASFVPTVADFARLDPRFRLPAGTWERLEGYADHGFAVFKLKAGKQEVHPMAFRFPRRDRRTLFFPTVHVHDGEVHEKARFDHHLYCQPGSLALRALMQWRESDTPLAHRCEVDRAQGILDGAQHAYRRRVRGMLKNEDIVLKQEP